MFPTPKYVKYDFSLFFLSSLRFNCFFLLFVSFLTDLCLLQVEIISLENIAGSNITRVIFAVDSDMKNMRISPTALSLVRSDLETVITHQSFLRLTPSLFGDPFSFDVLKLRGGITVIPKQSVFLMQNVQIQFNFTLNSSIDEIQDKFDELTSQLKSGVHLASYEVREYDCCYMH